MGHIDSGDHARIRSILRNLGYRADPKSEATLRAASRFRWFQETVMVFRRSEAAARRTAEAAAAEVTAAAAGAAGRIAAAAPVYRRGSYQ